jgi:thymidine kinase
MNTQHSGVGWIEAICGSMFSGKTEELIRRLKRAQIARQVVQIFKPAIDRRYDDQMIVSHSSQRLSSIPVLKAVEIPAAVKPEAQVIGIDEAQFFDLDLVGVCRDLALGGRRVIVAGLEQDYRGVPFETMMHIVCDAEYVTKNLAICVVCGNPAHRNQRITERGGRVVVGGSDLYEARCRRCFAPISDEEKKLFGEA